jgi:uncharacterized protein YqgQ
MENSEEEKLSLEKFIETLPNHEDCKKILDFIYRYLDCCKYPDIYRQLREAFQYNDRLFDRLERIVLIGDTASDKVPDDVQTFESFCEKNPAWKNPESYVCFRDDPQYKGKCVLKQRVQHSALCYIHAPSVLLYYLYKRNHPEFHELIDISHYIKNNFNNELLYKHLFGDIGGDSLDLLRHLTMHKVSIKCVNVEDITQEMLKKYGPMLAHSFLVYEDLIRLNISSHNERTYEMSLHENKQRINYFRNSRQLSFSSLNDLSMECFNEENIFKDAKGNACCVKISELIPDKKHALLLVGIRKDENDTYYLFQNWWKGKQFFEANSFYVEKCEVAINFVKEEIQEFLQTDLICGEYFETCCDFSNQNLSEIYNLSETHR